MTNQTEEQRRIAALEKEVAHLKTKVGEAGLMLQSLQARFTYDLARIERTVTSCN